MLTKLGLIIKKYILRIKVINRKWNRMKFLSLIIYELEKFNTLNLINDTLNKNNMLIWSNNKTKFICQLINWIKQISKKMISDLIKINKTTLENSIIKIKNKFKKLINKFWDFNINNCKTN